ncbi:MAG TPA: DUF2784 domain-containing protein [Gemmatimonadales bacterium]|jgi:hypothetical protein|nr:DUF2784 domain-containing protein [Gemmatimonadales bacterium]
MLYRLAADLLVVLHLAFVVFVVLGGFFALRWRQIAWAHVPAALWGAIIEFMGWVCPLTPLENHFRRLAGEGGYHGGFIEHYVIPALYPADYTLGLRIALGVMVVVLNGIAYWLYFSRRP